MKRLIIFIFLVGFNFSMKAQINIHGGAGANFSNVKITGFKDLKFNSTTNYYLSVRPSVDVLDKLTVSLDIQFSKKGYKNDKVDSLGASQYSFQFLDIMPEIEYRIIGPLSIFTGVSIGINTSERLKVNNVWHEAKTNLVNKTDVGLLFGIRVKISDRILLHTQFASSIFSASGTFTDDQGNDLDSKFLIRNFQLGAAYRII